MKFVTMMTVLAGLLVANGASAQYYDSGFGSQDTGCGPDFNVNYSNGGQGGSFGGFGGAAGGNSETYSVGITWKMDGACKKRQAAKNKRERAQAEQAQIKTLNDKIATCSRFDPMTAPRSIQAFCGDLVGVKVNAAVPGNNRYTPTYPQ